MDYCHYKKNFFEDLLVFIWKADFTEQEGEREWNDFPFVFHSPDGHDLQSWASPKPKASGFFQVSHLGAGA